MWVHSNRTAGKILVGGYVQNGSEFNDFALARYGTETTTKNDTATTLTSTPNPSQFGQTVTFTASVSSSSGTPTGGVTFSEGTTASGAATLNNGVATFTTSAFSAGNHTITATYNGDNDYNSSTSSPLTQTVEGSTRVDEQVYLPMVTRD